MSAELVQCPNCDYMNSEDATLCVRCSMVLSHSTRHLPTSPEVREIISPNIGGSAHIERKLYLHVRGSNDPIEFSLEEGDFILGRGDPQSGSYPDIDLANYEAADKGVSRKHAQLSYRGSTLKISDLSSANFTYLNGDKLIPNQARILRDNDEVRLGWLVLQVQFGEDSGAV